MRKKEAAIVLSTLIKAKKAYLKKRSSLVCLGIARNWQKMAGQRQN